ncbi:MAG: hypothetical protein CMF60_00220 [Magnetococcales bacterium]|nr:hypothetical protein [Magnetococcales bacterium]
MHYTAEQISEILKAESWRGFDAKALTLLEESVQECVDLAYAELGHEYVMLFETLTDHSANQIELFAKRLEMAFPKKSKHYVLDVGAGHGVCTQHLAKQPKVKVKAVEPSEYFYARHLLEMEREGTLPFGCAMKADMCHLPFENATFEGVYCNAVLHHQLYLPGKNIGIEKAMSEFSRVLIKGGQLYILTLLGEHHHIHNHKFFQSLEGADMEKLAKRNLLKVDNLKEVVSKGPFGDQTRWLEACLTKRT